ncbi:MAG: ubiquinone/menaquinone biosynthesis methyltransferase [Chloroflexota bacterium]|nr:ubiquinone/menaquinone biosynthesis methyltransferase [Chloroflexota bacterium]
MDRPRLPAQGQIQAMFDDIVGHYDVLNSLMALGLDGHWRTLTARAIGLQPAGLVLDLGCGSGTLSAKLGGHVRVVGVDVSPAMLALAKQRLNGRAQLVLGSAFSLPFRDESFAGAVSGFVLRNLDDLDGAFRELARVLKPGGRVALLDATLPQRPAMRRAFDLYFGRVAPALGRLAGKREAYAYLVKSLAHLPPLDELCCMLDRAGFEQTEARSLFVGAVTLFTGSRRQSL